MKKQGTKLAIALLALMCVGAGTTAVVAADNANSYVTASAATTVRTITKAGATGASTATALYVYAVEGDATGSGNWSDTFTLVAGTGSGIKLNGVALAYEMKQPGNDIYLGLGEVTVAEGDILTLDGTFFSEALDSEVVFKNCALKWNGSAWETYVVYNEYKTTSISATGASTATAVYIYPTEGQFPNGNDPDWANFYTFEQGSGTGLTLAGVALSTTDIKLPGTDFFVALGATANEGDILTVDGAYYNDTTKIKLVFDNCSLQWNGTAWVEYVETPAVVYEVYNISKVGATGDSSASVLYLYSLGDVELPKAKGDWDNVYSLEAGSGTGLTLNGAAASFGDMKMPGDLYLPVNSTVNVGDVFAIEGTFYNEAKAIKLVFENCKLQWNGTAWVEYVPQPDEIEYTTYNIGALKFKQMQPNADNMAYFNRADGQAITIVSTENDVNWTTAFSYDEGCVTLNGTAVAAGVKFPGDLFIELPLFPEENDELTIGGTFYSETLAVKYVIEETTFVWNGTAWTEKGAEPKTYDLGALTFHVNSKPWGGAGNVNNQLYLLPASEEALPVQSWDYFFKAESENNFKINDEVAPLLEMKSTDAGLFFLFGALEAGDKLTISGTFVCEALLTTYTFEETSFVWNGTSWEVFVDYTTYEIGELMFVSFANPDWLAQVNFAPVSGEAIPIVSTENDVNWTTAFNVRQGSLGVTLNGTPINPTVKFPHDMFLDLPSLPQEGDKLVIGGTFYSADLAVEYVVAESTFIYAGETWVSELQLAKINAQTELEKYKGNFVEADYYTEEWASFDVIIEEGYAAINAATTQEEIAIALADAKTAMDKVVTKAESDAIFEGLKVTTKEELATYKTESDYRADDWAAIQAILTTANAEIDAATSVTGINTAVDKAKAAIDAVKSIAQWEEAEAVVAAAKAELAAYKTEADYKAAQWAEIQAIIAEAGADLDEVVGNDEAIADIVADAKADMDAVKTAAVVDAEEAVVAAAKADLAAYKTEADYSATGWAAIQAIIAEAGADLDEAVGNEEEINAIVAAAKEDIDEVLTAAEEVVAALAAAKEAAREEVRAYYGALDHSKYDDEAETVISGYVAEVMAAIDAATTAEEAQSAVAEFKTKVESVDTKQPSGGNSGETQTSEPTESSKDDSKGGCGSVVGGGLFASVTLAAAAAMVLRKKKED